MKSYRVEYSPKALKDIHKFDPSVARLIVTWVRKNLEGCSNPHIHGHGLSGNLAGLWRYRVGDYRLIAEINDDRVVILMLEIGHRGKIYH